MNVTQRYSGDEIRSFLHSPFIPSYNLGEYNEEATLAQGYEIVRVFKPSDPEDTYVNMIYTNVLFLILFDCRERNVQRQDETEPPMSVSFVHRLPAFLKIPSSKQRCVIMK